MSDNQTEMLRVIQAVSKAQPKLAAKLQRDRSWLWLEGEYKDFPNTRKKLKELGFKYSPKGHALESGYTAHWYNRCGIRSNAPRGRSPAPETKVEAVKRPEPKKDLYVNDLDAEYEAMFGTGKA